MEKICDMINILVVEDEIPIAKLIELSLRKTGYAVTVANDGLTAIDLVEEKHFDLVLLDVMLPGANGFEVMEYIKPLKIPVIFLTARSELDDKLTGLTSGAEDYMVKPFEIAELLARINIVLRRYNKVDTVLSFRNITVDTENMLVTKDGKEVELTPKEYELIVLFIRNKGLTLYRDRIYEEVWGRDLEDSTRTIDLHVQRLRKKLDIKDCLQTVYSTGYRLSESK